MDKETATHLREALYDCSWDDWFLDPTEYTETGEKVNYFIRLWCNDETGERVPSPPLSAVALIDEIVGKQAETIFRCIDPDRAGESRLDTQYGRARPEAAQPYYEYIVDDPKHMILKDDAEEAERQRRLVAEICGVFHPAVQRTAAKGLAAEFQTLGDILSASEDELRACSGVGPKTSSAILSRQTQALRRRLGQTDNDVVVVCKNDDGLFEPVYTPDSLTQIRHQLISEQ